MLNFPNFPMINNFSSQMLVLYSRLFSFPLPCQMFKLSLLCRIPSTFPPCNLTLKTETLSYSLTCPKLF